MDKQALRRIIREQKRAMSPEEITRQSRELAARLCAHPAYRHSAAIYGYLSYNQEVQTLPILRKALQDGKRVAVPKVLGDTMAFLWLDDLNAVAKGYCGIPEPIANGPIADCPQALVLMPGLAFDREGHRLGYGGGFYDRFLEQEPNHPTLALCFDFQLLPEVVTDSHDIPVDYVISTKDEETL